MKKIIIALLCIMMCVGSFSSCNAAMSSKVIENVSQRQIDKNPHVAEWLAQDKSNSYQGINNHILEYNTFLNEAEGIGGDPRYTYKIVVLRTGVKHKANVDLEFVETETDITVKIIFTDKKAAAVDDRTVTYIEFKVPFNKRVYYDIICDGEDRELLERTDKNIAM